MPHYTGEQLDRMVERTQDEIDHFDNTEVSDLIEDLREARVKTAVDMANLSDALDRVTECLENCAARFGPQMSEDDQHQAWLVASVARTLLRARRPPHPYGSMDMARRAELDRMQVSVLNDISAERAKHPDKGFDAAYDATNSRNDWVGAAVAYIGRAADRVPRNEREGHNPREMLIKAAAILVAAIEDLDNKKPESKPVGETDTPPAMVLNKPPTEEERSRRIIEAMDNATAALADCLAQAGSPMSPMPIPTYVKDGHGGVATFYAIRDKRTLELVGSPPELYKSVQGVYSHTQGPLGSHSEVVKVQLLFVGLAE